MARAAYRLSLLVLMCTAWLVFTGTQMVRDVGDLARFGAAMFPFLLRCNWPSGFFLGLAGGQRSRPRKGPPHADSAAADRLSNSELVLGKLMASLLGVLVMLVAARRCFCLALLGGVSYGQIARTTAVTLAAVLVCGSLGSLLALWREKTFQALAMTVLILVLWLAIGEIVGVGRFRPRRSAMPCRASAAGFSPWQAMLEAVPAACRRSRHWVLWHCRFICFSPSAAAAALLLNGVAVAMVRVWNPSRENRWASGSGRRRDGEAARGMISATSGPRLPAPAPLRNPARVG